MRKLLLIIGFIASWGNILHAQSKIRIGIEAGPNYAGYHGFYGDSDFDSKISFTAGITSEFKIGNQFFLKTGLSFERKRATNESYFYINSTPPFDPGTPIAAYIQSDFLVCPILAKYEFSKYDSFYVALGGFFAFTLKSDFFDDYNYKDADVFKSSDFGFCLDVGKSFNVGLKNRVNIEIRENLGLADINKTSFSSGTVNTNSLNLILGYSFDLK